MVAVGGCAQAGYGWDKVITRFQFFAVEVTKWQSDRVWCCFDPYIRKYMHHMQYVKYVCFLSLYIYVYGYGYKYIHIHIGI